MQVVAGIHEMIETAGAGFLWSLSKLLLAVGITRLLVGGEGGSRSALLELPKTHAVAKLIENVI
jgi:hypothetical protein